MLNRLKAIVAKPPTSNKKFHRNTEDVLKSLGRKQKVEEENAFSFQRHFVSSEEEEEEKKRKKEEKETKRKRRKEAEEKLFYKTGTCTRESGTRRAMCRLQMRRARTLGRTETRLWGTVRKYSKAKRDRTLE